MLDVVNVRSELGDKLGRAEFDGWTIGEIVIGRVKMRNITVRCREGAINMMETLDRVVAATRKKRAGSASGALDLQSPYPTRKLSAEIKIYLDLLSRRNLSNCFLYNTKHALRLLICAAGDIPVGQIKSEHITDFWDAMLTWPSRGSHREEFKSMTDRQIVMWGKENNVPAPAARTLNLRLQLVRAFFKYLIDKDSIRKNPCDSFSKGIRVVDADKKRRAFTDIELREMFDHPRFKNWAAKFPHRWWMPMIGLFTGARVTEVAQLKVADIDQVDGFWVIHIRQTIDDDLVGKGAKFRSRAKIKCPSSIRTIPIAKELIEAGFLEYVEDVGKQHARLFPHLKHRISPKTGLLDGEGYAPIFKMQFRKYIKGFSSAEYLGFHAFRHRFISVMAAKQIPREVIGSITGHVVKDPDTHRQSVMDMFYIDPAIREEIRGHSMAEAITALMQLKPSIVLPRYTRGQFDKCFGPDAKLFP